MPPDPGFDQEIVLLGPVSTDLAEWDVQTFGANARRFRQHRTEIAFAKGEAAEAGERCLLPKRTVGVLACLVGRGIVRRQMLEDVKVLWKWWRSLPCADDLTHQLEGADNVNGLIGFTETRFPNGFLEGYLSHIARRIQDSRAAREIEARRHLPIADPAPPDRACDARRERPPPRRCAQFRTLRTRIRRERLRACRPPAGRLRRL